MLTLNNVLLSSISRYVNRSAAQSYAARVTISETQNKAAAWAASGEEIRLFDALSGLVNGSIVRSLMGEDFYTNHAEELLQLIHTMEENVGNPWNFLLPTKWVPHAAGRRLDRARIRMNEIYSERLRAREALPGDHKTDFDDFFAFTLQDKTTAPLQHFMSGHNTLLIFAAHTSTVAVIAWVIIDLLRRPEMMQRVLQEVRAPGAAEYPLLQACIKETSRVYIGFKMLRRAQKDVKIPGSEYVIPKGSLVSISPYLAHHDPENFPRPDEWIPERWLDSPTGEGSSELGSAKSVGGAGFMPFGSGCHRCPGEKLATVMVFRALVTLLGSWDVEWADEGVPSRTDFENFNFDKVGSAWLRGDVGVRFKSA
ncbi:Lanosterol 14-alpha demethylase [Escovopsis weberi]|uniref:Lanosterol 14-alpha demethylase n=1 Tax=Escovopsis weberi TaxID=150374 RepID=A0A0M8N865_ESCWE|nr:Lanosterol 14-alpha demethylase [Escovopsis weberi]